MHYLDASHYYEHEKEKKKCQDFTLIEKYG